MSFEKSLLDGFASEIIKILQNYAKDIKQECQHKKIEYISFNGIKETICEKCEKVFDK
jgi:hypothetical protein